MSESLNQFTFEPFFRSKAENNTDASMTLSVYSGSAFFNVFMRGLDRPDRLSLPKGGLFLLKKVLQQAIDGKLGCSNPLRFSWYNVEKKTFTETGMVVVGKDDDGFIFFGVTTPNIPPSKFITRPSMGVETDEELSEADRSVHGARILIDLLQTEIPLAMMLTSTKKENSKNNSYKSSKPSGHSPMHW